MSNPDIEEVKPKRTFTKMFIWVLLVLAGLVTVFAGVVAMQPSHFIVTRSATISAPPPEVFAQVNDFHNWEAWSPWATIDPNAKNSYEGPSSGKGAIFQWAGNSDVGEGKMLITESSPSELIRIKLEFFKPMPGVSDVEFSFKPDGDKSVVTWTMSGENNFIGRAMCLFMNMDEMVGGQFEKGLANIKGILEAAPKQ